jgi:ATP-binding protein involved in chromosome partitioning
MAYCCRFYRILKKVSLRMPELSKQSIEAKLAEYRDPYLGQDLLTAKSIQSIDIKDNFVKIALIFGYPMAGLQEKLIADLNVLLQPIVGSTPLEISIRSEIASHVGQRGIKSIPNVKNIIAVASGKGGVGKSTTAVNLAIALQKEGARVGILDADIYGPSQPMMLGASLPAGQKEQKILLPIMSHGIQSMSIGYLVDQTAAMIWRGPMVSTALQQLLNDTQWDNLDYLVVDLPPGTGDIQLTLAQKIPVSGAIVVTTPQDLALLDARRAYEMFRKVNIPVLGVVENMSIHRCSECGHAEHIFGEGGGQRLAEQYGIDMLGALPLDRLIREQTDNGIPTVAADPESANAILYREVARRIAAKLALQTKDYSHRFPTIVVKND